MISEEFAESMRTKLMELDKESKRLDSLVANGSIAISRAEYEKQVLIFDFAVEEATGLAGFGEIDRVAKSFADAKRALDGMAMYALTEGKREDYLVYRNKYNGEVRVAELRLVAGGFT